MLYASIDWATVIWAMTAAACGTFAVVNGLVWLRNRQFAVNGVFAIMALSAAASAFFELTIMHAPSPAVYALGLRWAHVPIFILMLGIIAFVKIYLRAGRTWLVVAVVLLRSAALLTNFGPADNLNFLKTTGLQHVIFLGDSLAVPMGERNPFMIAAQLSLLLLLAFVIDAGIQVWRRGERRKALVTSGAIAGLVFLGMLQGMLVMWGLVQMPLTPSLFFAGVIAIMGLELSRNVVRADQLATEVRESEARLGLAAEAANLGVWTRELPDGKIWATPHWRRLLGFTEAERITVDRFFERVHPEDRSLVRETLWKSERENDRYELEYRLLFPNGSIRWIASRGRFETKGAEKRIVASGVSVDITARKEAEAALHNQRNALAHLSRVTLLGELSGSLAHELNQPLTAILSNAQAALRFLDQPDLDRAEITEILREIVAADQRASDVIRSLRALFQKGETRRAALRLNAAIETVLRLLRSDFARQQIAIETHLDAADPWIVGDEVQLQQVLLNLLLNAADAMESLNAACRVIAITTEAASDAQLLVRIRDHGPGLSAEALEQALNPFFSTKPDGLGLGLAVCRTILEAHRTSLQMWNRPEGGAEFSFQLPMAGRMQ